MMQRSLSPIAPIGVPPVRILLVEDDPLLSDSTARALRSQGWVVDCTERGEPVAVSVRQDPYDLLILDVGLAGIEDRVRGLESGADDYLVKPFALSELVARSRALVRRNQARGGSVLSLGSLRMDLEARRAYIGEQELALAGREWSILQFMLSRTGKIVAKEQIIAAISNWDGTTSDNAIEVHVSRLRSKLEPAGLKIRTIRGFGYLLEEA